MSEYLQGAGSDFPSKMRRGYGSTEAGGLGGGARGAYDRFQRGFSGHAANSVGAASGSSAESFR